MTKYNLNGIELSLTRTFTYQAEERFDPRDGMMCAELVSDNGRYKLITDMDTFTALEVVKFK